LFICPAYGHRVPNNRKETDMRAALLYLCALVAAVALAATSIAAGSPPLLPLPAADQFVRRIDNPWFPLVPGTRLTYRGVKDGRSAIDVMTVTSRTQNIAGIPATVVSDRLFEKGRLAERTTDYYGQDQKGNVWYLGEDTATLNRAGKVLSTEGSWRTGVNGGRAGVFMPAHPTVGYSARQEFSAGQAEDQFRVASLSAHVRTPGASSRRALLSVETTALEPGVVDHKFYVRGVGTVDERTVKGGNEHLTLIRFKRP
jgi:hypothetical protein